MSSVLSANSAFSTSRVVAPVPLRPVDGVAAAARDGTSALPTANSPTAGVAASSGASASSSASTSSTPANAKPATALSKAELASQVHALQAKMDKLNPALAFVVDEDSGRALIQLTDRATKEVIQQFPTEAAMQISKALDRYQKGQLINLTV